MTRFFPSHTPVLLCIVLGLAMGATDAKAASSQPLTINYALAARVSLTLSPTTVNFPDTDPTTVPAVPAAENPVMVTAKFRKDPATVLTATLVCQGGPLVSGADTIPASSVTWSATGTGFTGGTLNNAAPQPVGSWTGSGAYTGNLNFSLANLWSYPVGNYTGNITYTLTAP